MSLTLERVTYEVGSPHFRIVAGMRRGTVGDIWIDPYDGRATWHLWDRNGCGGENSVERDLQTAVEVAVVCLLRAKWIARITADEFRAMMAVVVEFRREEQARRVLALPGSEWR